ncbi:hypothetical protein MJH12_15885 [bacterium]|nr:hypothetical protein [bacterium]
MKNLFRMGLCISTFIMAVCANQASEVSEARANLSSALSTFVELRDSGLLSYSVKINKKRYQARLDLIARSSKTLSASDLDNEAFQSSHKDASQALIGIRGLKNAGSIYYNSKKGRELYLAGFKSLTGAVLGLYELKSKNDTREMASVDHSTQSRFIVTKENSYNNMYTVITFDPKVGMASKTFKGIGAVRYALNFVMFKQSSYGNVCVAVSYLDASSSFNSKNFKCSAIFSSNGEQGAWEALNFKKDEIVAENFNELHTIK